MARFPATSAPSRPARTILFEGRKTSTNLGSGEVVDVSNPSSLVYSRKSAEYPASCPPALASAMIVLKHVLLPVDFSDNSVRATEYAILFCQRYRATLHLLHVIEDPMVYLPVLESYSLPSHGQLETYAQDRLENWLPSEQVDGLTVEYQWMHGNPAARIVEYARDCRLDLIVMGAHGRGGATHLLMGNTAEKVVRRAPCPVLTVNPETTFEAQI